MFIPPKYTSWFLGAIVVITLIFGSALTQLKFDFDVENLFPRHDKDLRFYQEHIDDFKSDKTYMIIGIEANGGVFNPNFLARLDAFTREMDSSEMALSASSITNVRYYLINPFFKTTERPVIHPLEPDSYEKDSLFLVHYPDVKEKFISSLGTAVTVYLELPNDIDSIDGQQFMSQLEEKLRRHGFEQYHFSGGMETDNVYVETLKSELTLLLSLSLLLILVVLFVTFRSFPGVMIPFLIIILTVIWTMAAMALWGVAINVISVLIPSVISIVALSDVIHIMSRYQEEVGKSDHWRTAMQLVMKDIGMAILLTSLTTALGFLTLGFADILPFIEFGVFT
ncbi:MAG: MMPL family transporter, partial [Bacteroidetes bacterium]|nr:MMPL family transporter [Bacteroidota bacterium]